MGYGSLIGSPRNLYHHLSASTPPRFELILNLSLRTPLATGADSIMTSRLRGGLSSQVRRRYKCLLCHFATLPFITLVTLLGYGILVLPSRL